MNLVEKISSMQSELNVTARSMRDDYQIQALANIDAVHYSTKIEGNKLTKEQVTVALETHKGRATRNHDIQEVINYSSARKFISEKFKSKINIEDVLSVHALLLNKIVVGKLKGHFRQAQNAIKDSQTGEIVYLPPEAKDVMPLMNGLMKWLHKSKIEKMSPLILAPVFHFEFVTIHPFLDGNGRSARLLTNAIFSGGGYTVEKYAALEKQHEKERSLYYKSLRSLQSQNYYDIPAMQNITPWIIYWLT